MLTDFNNVLVKTDIKGLFHPKMKIIIYSPSCCSKPVWVSFLCWTQKKIFWRMLVSRQLTVAVDCHSIFFLLWKSMAPVNHLVNSYRFGTVTNCSQTCVEGPIAALLGQSRTINRHRVKTIEKKSKSKNTSKQRYTGHWAEEQHQDEKNHECRNTQKRSVITGL